MKIKDIIDKLSSRFIPFYFGKTDDEIENNKFSYFTKTILIVTIYLLLILSLIRLALPPQINLSDYLIWIFTGLILIIYQVFRKGKVQLAGVLYVITFWLSMTTLAWTFEGVRDVSIVAYILIILIAMLITKPWQSLVLSALSIISVWAIFFAEQKGIIIPVKDTSLNYSLEFSAIMIFVIVLITLNAINSSDVYKRIKKELEDRYSAEDALNQSEEIRRKDEEALIRSKALLISIMDSTDDLIWSVDTDQFRLLTFNKGMESVLKEAGIQIKEGMLHEDIFPRDSWEKLFQLYYITLKEGSVITMFQTTLVNRTLWINLHLLTHDSKPYAISGFAKDITELKKAEEALIKAKEKAEENDRLKTAFMNNISHEIRTPLNGIMGFSQLVTQQDITASEKETYLNILNFSSERLLNTITDYMDISLIVSGSINVHKAQLNLSRFLNEIYDIFQAKCKAKNLEFIKELPSDNKIYTLSCDTSLLEKSISHLMNNAIKFTQNGSISLGLRVSNNNYEILIRDTGTGIIEEAQEKIFEYFMQEEHSSTRGYEGSGLGLSIAKGLVEMMGGRIRLESVKGVGSTFFIVFPAESSIISKDDLSIIEQSQSHSEPGKSPLVLIVDDDEISLLYHKKILEAACFRYLIANNGLDAVNLCRDYPDISIILMDIKMSEIDGLTAVNMIRVFRKDLPVIAVSAYAMIGDIEKAFDAGCNDYITKPVNSALLLSSINKQLQKYS